MSLRKITMWPQPRLKVGVKSTTQEGRTTGVTNWRRKKAVVIKWRDHLFVGESNREANCRGQNIVDGKGYFITQ